MYHICLQSPETHWDNLARQLLFKNQTHLHPHSLTSWTVSISYIPLRVRVSGRKVKSYLPQGNVSFCIRKTQLKEMNSVTSTGKTQEFYGIEGGRCACQPIPNNLKSMAWLRKLIGMSQCIKGHLYLLYVTSFNNLHTHAKLTNQKPDVYSPVWKFWFYSFQMLRMQFSRISTLCFILLWNMNEDLRFSDCPLHIFYVLHSTQFSIELAFTSTLRFRRSLLLAKFALVLLTVTFY